MDITYININEDDLHIKLKNVKIISLSILSSQYQICSSSLSVCEVYFSISILLC